VKYQILDKHWTHTHEQHRTRETYFDFGNLNWGKSFHHVVTMKSELSASESNHKQVLEICCIIGTVARDHLLCQVWPNLLGGHLGWWIGFIRVAVVDTLRLGYPRY
jgi:hypothetical protein